MTHKKIEDCVKAKKDKNFKIIARSDAKGVEGIDKMIDRCKAYIDAGAEIIFPEALADSKEVCSLNNKEKKARSGITFESIEAATKH